MGMLEYRSTGVLEYKYAGVPEYWSNGALGKNIVLPTRCRRHKMRPAIRLNQRGLPAFELPGLPASNSFVTRPEAPSRSTSLDE